MTITDTDHDLTVNCRCTPLRPEEVQPFDVVTHVQGDAEWVFVQSMTQAQYERAVKALS